mgnify:CR=1 FL=1
MCLVQEPRLLLLDEPTAGMSRADTNNTIDLLREIRSRVDLPLVLHGRFRRALLRLELVARLPQLLGRFGQLHQDGSMAPSVHIYRLENR